MVSAGGCHTVLLRSDGDAVADGMNHFGQCDIPLLDDGFTYTQVSAGARHTVLLRSDGSAVVCGKNDGGQCNIPRLPDGMIYTQVSAGWLHTVLLRSDGFAVVCGRNDFRQCNIPHLEDGMKFTQVSAGMYHTVLLRSDGIAVSCGRNDDGQCNIPPLEDGMRFIQVSAGEHHTVLLRSDGSAVFCGRQDLASTMAYKQVSAGGRHTVLLTSDGRAEAFGMNDCGQCNIPGLEDGIKFSQVSAGQDHTVLLRSDGHVVLCGKRGRGRGTQTPIPGTWYVADSSLGRDLVLQLDCDCEDDDNMLLTFSGLAGDEVMRLNARPSDPAWHTQKRIAHELKVPLQSLRVVLPDGQLLAAVCRASPGASLADIECVVPEFEASTVLLKVRILPLGFARSPDNMAEFTQLLTYTSLLPNEGSLGGREVTFTGKGFSSNASRHFVRVGGGDAYGTCEPISSTYSSLTCLGSPGDSSSYANPGVEIMLWDVEVSKDPLSAFGESATGCLKRNDDYKTYNCMSEEECALRCLTTWDCKSFDFRARFQTCFLSKTSFTNCDDCKDPGYLDCRYYERRTEKTPRSAVQLTINSVFHYRTSLTADIQSLVLPDMPMLGSTATLRALIANPAGGSANVSFDGAPCTLTTVTSVGEDTVDVNCTLGEVPGGFASFPMLQVADAGVTFEESTWLKMPLSIESADSQGEISSSSLGGGWTLTVTGQGFSPAKSTGAETYVEVTVCGKPCDVVGVPKVTTPEVVLGTSDAVVPALGTSDGTFGVGAPQERIATLARAPERKAFEKELRCVDFGSFTNARVEKIRWHPLYDALEADQYINSKIQIGSLSSTQTCDELSYDWRGSEYRGCQASWEILGKYGTKHEPSGAF
eukprot:s214_g23.t1